MTKSLTGLAIALALFAFTLPATAQQAEQPAKYLLLATNRTGTMELEMNEAPPEYEFVGMTVFSSTFGGQRGRCHPRSRDRRRPATLSGAVPDDRAVAGAGLILNRNRGLWGRSRRNRWPVRSRGKSTSRRSRMPSDGAFRRASGSLWAELSIGESADSDLYHRMLAARESVLVVSDVLQLSKISKRATGWVDQAPSYAATSNSWLMN